MLGTDLVVLRTGEALKLWQGMRDAGALGVFSIQESHEGYRCILCLCGEAGPVPDAFCCNSLLKVWALGSPAGPSQADFIIFI